MMESSTLRVLASSLKLLNNFRGNLGTKFGFVTRICYWDLLLRSYIVLHFRTCCTFRVKFENVIVSGAKFEYLLNMWV